MTPPNALLALTLAFSAILAGASTPAAAGNVTWARVDSVVTCPAGDSVVAGRPARLRIVVTYADAAQLPRVGVPPESIAVEWTPGIGAVRVNDQPGRAEADDSTDAQGRARVTLPSLSGCGTLTLTLRVAGEVVGAIPAFVRSTDTDLDGRTTAGDAPCDLNGDGVVDGADASLRTPHTAHSHRNAVFGALVRRTSLCEGCEDYEAGNIGESTVSWSPDGRRIAFTVHLPPDGECAVFIVDADPGPWDAPVQFTFPGPGVHDYDPTWSPLGTEIAFGRDDNTVWMKGVQGLAPDTTLRLVTRHNDGTALERGDLTPAISPDGQWVAFTRKSTALGHYELWKTPANGDTTQRVRLVEEATGDDFYPHWSPDGVWIVFDRYAGGRHSVWKVSAAGGGAIPVLVATGATMAGTPAYAPDGAVLVAGVGTVTAPQPFTLDATLLNAMLPSPAPTAAFPDAPLANSDPILSPRYSPDGTRLALRTDQLWVTRRNTSLPPVFGTLAGQPVLDAVPVISIAATVGAPLAFTVTASDPEGDALVFTAAPLADGMTFDAGTRTFAWTPPGAALGSTRHVRFDVTTPSGGADYAIARIVVSGGADRGPEVAARIALAPPQPNPFRERTTLRLDLPAAAAVRAEVFDPAGRHVRTLVARALPAGRHTIAWDGLDAAGRPAPAGLYLCRVRAGAWHAERRLLRLR